MTFLGKMLVVLQVVLTILFMAFAGGVYSFHQSWRARHDAVQQQLSDTRNELTNVESEFSNEQTRLEAALQTSEDRVTDVEAQNTRLTDDLTTANENIEQLTTERNQISAAMEIAVKEAEERREEAIKQREENRLLHEKQEELAAIVGQLGDELADVNRSSDEMVEKQTELLERLAFLNLIIRKNDIETDPKAYAGIQEPPPSVEGVVWAAKSSTRRGIIDFIEISLGSDDGIAVGHSLFVSRPGKYLGKIKIVSISSDRAVGTVIRRTKNGIIERGDNVTAKL